MITEFRSTIWGRLKDMANAKVVQLCGPGVPTANTGKRIAGRGSQYTDITAGDIYINKGTHLVPNWAKANVVMATEAQVPGQTPAQTPTQAPPPPNPLPTPVPATHKPLTTSKK